MTKNSIVTIYDVARIAGVSMATVSRVLNNPDKVNPETKARVLKIIEEIGYKPNPIARELATKKKIPTVGIIVSDITNNIVSQMLSGVFDAAEDLNFTVKLFQVSKKRSLSDFISDVMIEKIDSILFLNDCCEDGKFNVMINEFKIYKTPYKILNVNDSKTTILPHERSFNAIKILSKNWFSSF